MELEDDYRTTNQDIEPDSDVDDVDCESQLSQWLGELENYAKGLDGLEPGDTGTVRRRQQTVVTPKMAMESFRYSFMSENQDVNFDAILGELCELENQLGTAQSELANPTAFIKDENRDSGNDFAQSELDALASEISHDLGCKQKRPMGDLDYFHTHYPGDLGGFSDALLDIGETDSAFSESASLPSSESFTSMVTVSSSVETAGLAVDGSGLNQHQPFHCDRMCPCMRFANHYNTNHYRSDSLSSEVVICQNPAQFHEHEEQKAIIKAEKIRIALEKIKEAKIRKLFVRAFAKDGSSKSIMVDEKMTILEVISILADKNHVRLNPDLAVIEHMPELFMERVLEDHDSLVENMVMWTRDTKNKILFESRTQKNDLFKSPERYLLVSSASERGASLDPKRRENLIQEFFSGSAAQVPEVEGVLHLKTDGKKAWKKYYFVLRASGLYYNPKGKISKSPKDLVCLVQFEFVELYYGFSWKKKYHSPTDYCFALKHPQIQKKTSKFILYLCAENKAALDQWIMGIRIAKFGKQLLINFQNLQREILTWDTREYRASLGDQAEAAEALAELNQGDLTDSRLSMPEPGCRHSIVVVKNPVSGNKESLQGRVSDDSNISDFDQIDGRPPIERKSSLTSSQTQEGVKLDKVPVKRVSFSTTHSVINDCGEVVVPARHRDSITSASTDSSEDSTSSGEGRMSLSHRGSKMRAKLPVTTGTTKQISEMVQTSLDGINVGSFDIPDEPKISNPGNQKDINERRKSAPVCNSEINGDKKGEGQYREHSRSMSQQYDQLPMSPTSRLPTSPQPVKGSKVYGYSQKEPKTHSRGSSISSVDSNDSYQGHLMSPTSPTGNYGYIEQYHSQSPMPLYESIESSQMKSQTIPCPSGPLGQGHVLGHGVKQGPPTAQKPVGMKKNRPSSGTSTGSVEKGHKRNTSNTSKSSLESVEEEAPKVTPITGPKPLSSPIPPRSKLASPPPPPLQIPSRVTPGSQNMIMSAQNFMTQSPSPPIMHQSAPAAPFDSQSPIPGTPQSPLGCLSPRLSGNRSSGLKPVPPPAIPVAAPVPPPLVPPAPHTGSSGVKTHKKRPSGGNIVVNGNQVNSHTHSSSYPNDIVASSPRSQSVLESQGQNRSMCANYSSNEDMSYAPLPFMAELSKHMHKSLPQSIVQKSSETKMPPETLPKPTDNRHKVNGNVLSSSQNDYNVCQSESVEKQSFMSQLNKKSFPPPPPRRSESTRLSSKSNAADDMSVPNETDIQNIDPIYDNCDGILDINDLPPPPPELLEGYGSEGHGQSKGQGHLSKTGGRRPPPPPPPKRNKDTQLPSS